MLTTWLRCLKKHCQHRPSMAKNWTIKLAVDGKEATIEVQLYNKSYYIKKTCKDCKLERGSPLVQWRGNNGPVEAWSVARHAAGLD